MKGELIFFFVLLLYLAGILVWNNKAYSLWKQEIDKPWQYVLDNYNHDKCAYWLKVSEAFPLQDWPYMINPYMWVKNWNWKPPEVTK